MIVAPIERLTARVDRYWDEYTDLGSALLAVARVDLPAVLFDELLHDREAEARSFRLARDVRLECLMHDVAQESPGRCRQL